MKIQIISYNESNILKNSSVAKIEALLSVPEIFTEQFCTIKKKKKVKIKSTSTLNSCKEVHRVITTNQALHYTLFFLPISSLSVLGKLHLQCGLRTLNGVL